MYELWIEQLDKAPHRTERARVIREFARVHGYSQSKAYRVLNEAGWDSGRKRRRDAGTTRQNWEAVQQVSAKLREGLRKNGKATMSVNQARAILAENGVDFAVSDSRLRTLLKEANLDLASLRKPSPYQRLRTLHPNHVHQVDPSLALVYYAPDGTQHIIRVDEAYKNKPFLKGKEHLKCWRYVLADHYSNSVVVRYYASHGENAANLYDFLLYAWGEKSNEIYQFHGLPDLLVWDAGSANTSRAVTRALAGLGVEVTNHMPGNPRAKGSVEKANDLWEKLLESRLKAEPVNSVEELNELAERFCAAYNADMIPGQDCRLTRMGRRIGSRLSLWQHIEQDQLKELPDPDLCRLLFTHEAVTRKVDGALSVSFAHPRTAGTRYYSLHGQPGVTIGMTVEVQPILTSGEPVLLAAWNIDGERYAVELVPIETDEAGFAVDAAVIGQEYKRPADTLDDHNKKELTLVAYGEAEPGKKAVPFQAMNNGQGLKTHSYVNPSVDIAPVRKVGKKVSVTGADIVRPHEIMISHVEAVKRVRGRVGSLPEGYLKSLKLRYPNGVPATDIEQLETEITEYEKQQYHYQFVKEA